MSVNFSLSKEKHRELKLKAFSQGLTISDVLCSLIDNYIKDFKYPNYPDVEVTIIKPKRFWTKLKELFYD